MKKKTIFFGLFIVIFLYTLPILRSIYSVNMESSFYKIQMGTIDIAGGKKSSDSYNLSDSIGQTAAGEFQSAGYIVKAGFQYLHSIIPFTFSISETRINFGTLIANSPQTATTTLNVSFGGSGGYQVTAIEEGPMRTFNNASTIPDTSCNGDGNTCTESLAKPWTSSSAYGFGYNMSGTDIPSDFIDDTYFRPFPDRLQGENPAVVMSSTNVGRNSQATVTFKINISPIQVAGSYQTIINYVATPTF